ncbi:hypothetical protein B0H21DRAFT_753592, partial [Amylocystis lapponica]
MMPYGSAPPTVYNRILHHLPKMSLSSADMSDIVVPSTASIQNVLHAAVKLSLTGGDFTDTTFYVFSRRTNSRMVKAPRVVFANSISLRKASAHFERLLSGGFTESMSGPTNISSYSDEQMPLGMYGYESDSDLEDEDDDVRLEGEQHGAGEKVPKEFPGLDVETADSLGDSIDATAQEVPALYKDFGKAGKSVFVKDMAFKTWQAFVFYTYFEKVAFAPLRSQTDTPGLVVNKQGWPDLYEAPLCSPKSMYRLAEKYDLTALRQLAITNIKTKLSGDNILLELFTPFTSRYPEILQLEIQYICDNSSIKPKLVASLPRWLEKVASGDLPHSGAVLIALYQNLKVVETKVVETVVETVVEKITGRNCPNGHRQSTCSSCGAYLS